MINFKVTIKSIIGPDDTCHEEVSRQERVKNTLPGGAGCFELILNPHAAGGLNLANAK